MVQIPKHKDNLENKLASRILRDALNMEFAIKQKMITADLLVMVQIVADSIKAHYNGDLPVENLKTLYTPKWLVDNTSIREIAELHCKVLSLDYGETEKVKENQENTKVSIQYLITFIAMMLKIDPENVKEWSVRDFNNRLKLIPSINNLMNGGKLNDPIAEEEHYKAQLKKLEEIKAKKAENGK